MTTWAEITGFNGRYRISERGCIQTNSGGAWRDMAKPLDANGYELVYLWDSSVQSKVRRLVHQVVAEEFVPSVDGLDCVNHLDGNKRNNHYSNLEWTTRAENMRHAWRTGLCKPNKLTELQVREILECGGTDTATASRYGVSQVMVTRIRARKAWKHVQ